MAAPSGNDRSVNGKAPLAICSPPINVAFMLYGPNTPALGMLNRVFGRNWRLSLSPSELISTPLRAAGEVTRVAAAATTAVAAAATHNALVGGNVASRIGASLAPTDLRRWAAPREALPWRRSADRRRVGTASAARGTGSRCAASTQKTARRSRKRYSRHCARRRAFEAVHVNPSVARVVVTVDAAGPSATDLRRIVANAERDLTVGSARRPSISLPGDDVVIVGRTAGRRGRDRQSRTGNDRHCPRMRPDCPTWRRCR